MIPRFIASLIILASGIAQAATYQFNLGGGDYSNRIVNIQQLIQQTYPGFQLPPNSILRQVVIFGKGWDNTSTAELYFDRQLADNKPLAGLSQNYYSNDPLTYTNLSLMNTLRTPSKNIEVYFRGAARVMSIAIDVVDFAPPPPPPPQPLPPPPPPPMPPPHPQPHLVFVDIGTERTMKFVSATRSFAPAVWSDIVNQIVITATVERPNIERAVVIFDDGSARELPELAQSISTGRQVGVFIGNRRIREVQIQSTCGNLAGSRAEFKVSLGVLR